MSEISTEVGGSKSTISKVVRRFSERGEVKIAEKSERPKKLNEYSRRVLIHEMKSNCRVPLSIIVENLLIPMIVRILHTEVHNLGMNNCVAVKKPFLSPKHNVDRLALVKRYLH